MQKLSIKAFTLAFGLRWALVMLFIGLLAFFGWGEMGAMVNFFSFGYVGFEPTFMGIVIGVIRGFVDGAVGGALLAWLYNLFV